MLLSDHDEAADPIAPATRRVAALLAREKTGEILAHLHRRPHRAASEIARLEDIHVATAQRYLKELVEAGLIGSRLRQGAPRPTEEYWVLKPKITITVDLEENPAPTGSVLVEAAKRIGVSDAVPANIVFDADPRTGTIENLLILDGRQPRQVAERIRLSETLGRFLSRVPTDGRDMSVWDVMRSANLAEDHLPEVLAALGRFAYPHDTHADGHGDGDTAGSARPLDPQTRRLFYDLTRATSGVPAASPPVPIVRLQPLEPVGAAEAAPGADGAADSDAAPTPRSQRGTTTQEAMQ